MREPMTADKKRSIVFISLNTAVMVLLFFFKFVMLPKIPSINLSDGSALNFLLTWAPIPLISIIGMIVEKHMRFWIIPDLVYCILTFIYSGIDQTYGIGMFGIFGNVHYDLSWALTDRFITFVLMLLFQIAVQLIIMRVNKNKTGKDR